MNEPKLILIQIEYEPFQEVLSDTNDKIIYEIASTALDLDRAKFEDKKIQSKGDIVRKV